MIGFKFFTGRSPISSIHPPSATPPRNDILHSTCPTTDSNSNNIRTTISEMVDGDDNACKSRLGLHVMDQCVYNYTILHDWKSFASLRRRNY